MSVTVGHAGRLGGRRRRIVAVAVGALAVLATACEPPPPSPPPGPPVMPAGIGAPVIDPTFDGPHQVGYLTTEHRDRFDWAGGPGTMAVSAPSTNIGGNTRGVFVAASTPATWDHEACVSWQGGHGRLLQQGVALRVRDEGGGTRAITVTKNIYFGATWFFNVHLWEPGGAIRGIGGRDFSNVVAPEPWHLCARVVGDKVEVKLWTGTDPVPAWGDERHTGVVQLPRGWVYAGRPGGYAGHLEKNDTLQYTNLRTAAYPRPRADAETVTRALYDKVQRRTPAATNVELWKTRLQDGWTRQQAAQTFATDRHGRRISIDDAYRSILSRPVDPSGLAHWTGHLDRGGSYRSFIGALGNATSLPRTRAGDEAYVAHLWQAVLGRPSSAQDRSVWADRLGSGWSRRSVAEYVWGSGEARTHQAGLAFLDVVGRAPTAAERAHWAGRFTELGSDPIRLRAEIVIDTVALPLPTDPSEGSPDPGPVPEPEPEPEPEPTVPPETSTPVTEPPDTTAADPDPTTTTTEAPGTTTTAPAPPPATSVTGTGSPSFTTESSGG